MLYVAFLSCLMLFALRHAEFAIFWLSDASFHYDDLCAALLLPLSFRHTTLFHYFHYCFHATPYDTLHITLPPLPIALWGFITYYLFSISHYAFISFFYFHRCRFHFFAAALAPPVCFDTLRLLRYCWCFFFFFSAATVWYFTRYAILMLLLFLLRHLHFPCLHFFLRRLIYLLLTSCSRRHAPPFIRYIHIYATLYFRARLLSGLHCFRLFSLDSHTLRTLVIAAFIYWYFSPLYYTLPLLFSYYWCFFIICHIIDVWLLIVSSPLVTYISFTVLPVIIVFRWLHLLSCHWCHYIEIDFAAYLFYFSLHHFHAIYYAAADICCLHYCFVFIILFFIYI